MQEVALFVQKRKLGPGKSTPIILPGWTNCNPKKPLITIAKISFQFKPPKLANSGNPSKLILCSCWQPKPVQKNKKQLEQELSYNHQLVREQNKPVVEAGLPQREISTYFEQQKGTANIRESHKIMVRSRTVRKGMCVLQLEN